MSAFRRLTSWWFIHHFLLSDSVVCVALSTLAVSFIVKKNEVVRKIIKVVDCTSQGQVQVLVRKI